MGYSFHNCLAFSGPLDSRKAAALEKGHSCYELAHPCLTGLW